MKTSTVFAISLIAVVAPQAWAQQLPPLAAKVYPGAVAWKTKAGKTLTCGYGEDHHDPYCFLTKDPIEKVRAFYAQEGVNLESIPIGKEQNAAGDGLYQLEEAVRLQLGRETIGSLYAGPVEFWRTHSSADEVSYFNSVVVMTGKTTGKLQGSAQANAAVLMVDPIFLLLVLRPETAAIYDGTVELLVSPERLVPMYNKHSALQGAFLKTDDGASAIDKLIANARVTRSKELMSGGKSDYLKTQDNKAKAVEALLGELEKEAYPTLIMIQRSRKDGVTRDPATLQKEWRAAIRFPRGK